MYSTQLECKAFDNTACKVLRRPATYCFIHTEHKLIQLLSNTGRRPFLNMRLLKTLTILNSCVPIWNILHSTKNVLSLWLVFLSVLFYRLKKRQIIIYIVTVRGDTGKHVVKHETNYFARRKPKYVLKKFLDVYKNCIKIIILNMNMNMKFLKRVNMYKYI